MSRMRRADRRDSSYDNEIDNPQNRKQEPASIKDLRMSLMTARSQRDEAKAELKLTSASLCEEQSRAYELLLKYEHADSERLRYIGLYGKSQVQLKFERRSKAGIRGWETRRKNENNRLKSEIAEMIVLLRDSLNRKDEAVAQLYGLADRIDKVQAVIDSDEDDSNTPKLRRIWVILNELMDR